MTSPLTDADGSLDAVRLTPPGAADEPALRDWLDAFLRAHLGDWSSVLGERWSDVAIRAHIEEHGLVDRELRELTRANDHPGGFVRVARADGRPVGVVYAEIRPDRYLCTPIGVLSWIFTDPSVRGQGVARLMMDAVDGWFAWRGVAAREVFVTASNTTAVRVYERQGYRLSDQRMLGVVHVGTVAADSE